MKRGWLFYALILFSMISFTFFMFDIKKVKGISMFPNINDGDVILVFRLAYGIRRFSGSSYFLLWNNIKPKDVVVYKMDDRIVLKRVALTSGSRLKYVERNGEKYLMLDCACVKLDSQSFQNIFANGSMRYVPNGYFLALGDNLSSSHDSRHYGFVSNESILGKVLCR